VPSPSYGVTSMFGSVLTGVSAASATSAWAVGYYSKPGPAAEFQTLILHWNGTNWTRVPSPEPPNSFLSGAAAVSATDAWAVGQYTTPGNVITALALHWDGTRWTQVTVPFPAGALGTGLSGVSADSPTDAWAVGDYSVKSTGGQETLALHWNGTTWTRVATPTPKGTVFRFLNGVAARAPTDAWAVGADSSNNAPITLILHWDGTAWTQVPSPDPGGNNGNRLFGVAATSASDAWAVGDYNSRTTSSDLILHWNGTSWTRS